MRRLRARLGAELGELREGLAVLISPEFWQAFYGFWGSEAMAARIDGYVHDQRTRLGLPPDPALEQRRSRRRPRPGGGMTA